MQLYTNKDLLKKKYGVSSKIDSIYLLTVLAQGGQEVFKKLQFCQSNKLGFM